MNGLTIVRPDNENLTPIEVLLQIGEDGRVSAKNTYEFLELDPSHYSRWCKNSIIGNEFAEEGADFEAFAPDGERESYNPNPTTDYRLSVTFAKKLCMKAGGERGEQARNYFVKCEEKLRDIAVNVSALSPEMQMFKHIFDAMAGMQMKEAARQKQVNDIARKTAEHEGTIAVIKDTIIQRDDNWRESMNALLNKTAKENASITYQELRAESYAILEERAHCDLSTRLRNLRDRLTEGGARKTQINSANKLDCIESDARLREIYTSVVKELSIRYAA